MSPAEAAYLRQLYDSLEFGAEERKRTSGDSHSTPAPWAKVVGSGQMARTWVNRTRKRERDRRREVMATVEEIQGGEENEMPHKAGRCREGEKASGGEMAKLAGRLQMAFSNPQHRELDYLARQADREQSSEETRSDHRHQTGEAPSSRVNRIVLRRPGEGSRELWYGRIDDAPASRNIEDGR